MFNNIIYFIVVLIIFNMSSPAGGGETSLSADFLAGMGAWAFFTIYTRWCFNRLLSRNEKGADEEGRLTLAYQSLGVKLSILAILLFALDVYALNLKHWLQGLPGIKSFSVLQGILAILLFIGYLGTIWYFSYPVYRKAFQIRIERWSFIVSNFRLNVPILFPWLILSFLYDLISLSPWAGVSSFLNKPFGQIVFFATLLMALMVFMPLLIQYWWGCREFASTEKVDELKGFLREKGFKYRSVLKWPIFEGHMLTAGIMGIIPRYRYILVTESLMEILSTQELKGVLAHEMGHAKYRHMLFYMIFFLGYLILMIGVFDSQLYQLISVYILQKIPGGNSSENLSYLFLSLPILITMVLYFRYVMGYFMRHFERQADLYSAVAMGSPRPAISSLEKIALLSGKSRELPSWHHFSIRERVDNLWRFTSRPGLVKRQNRLVGLAFVIYMSCMVGMGYFLNFGAFKETLTYRVADKILNQAIAEDPENIRLYESLAMVYQQMGSHRKAIHTYETILGLDQEQALSLNNLAWLLVTAPEEELRNIERALSLAKEAVALERSSIYLDTLAEAYYANGLVPEAIETIKEAILMAPDDLDYYRKQLQKFLGKTESI